MANRIVGNVIIIDSAMGNSFVLTSANQAVNLDNLQINAIAFLSVNTTSTITLTGANTATDIIYSCGYLAGYSAVLNNANPLHFSTPQLAKDIKVPVLTAGTGFLYLA